MSKHYPILKLFTLPVDAVTWVTDSIIKKTPLVSIMFVDFLDLLQLYLALWSCQNVSPTPADRSRKHVITDGTEGAAGTPAANKIILPPKNLIPQISMSYSRRTCSTNVPPCKEKFWNLPFKCLVNIRKKYFTIICWLHSSSVFKPKKKKFKLKRH